MKFIVVQSYSYFVNLVYMVQMMDNFWSRCIVFDVLSIEPIIVFKYLQNKANVFIQMGYKRILWFSLWLFRRQFNLIVAKSELLIKQTNLTKNFVDLIPRKEGAAQNFPVARRILFSK